MFMKYGFLNNYYNNIYISVLNVVDVLIDGYASSLIVQRIALI